MYIKKYWGNFIGGSDDSLNLVVFLEDLKKEEIPLSEIFVKIRLDKQNWHQGSSGTFPDFPQHMAVKGVIINPVLGAVVLSKGIVAVSYTHLDVYKRQGFSQ